MAPKSLKWLLLLSLLALFGLTASADAQSTGTTTTYTVKWGDTLFSIAQQHGVQVDAIVQANELATDQVVAGQKLIIPGSTTLLPSGEGTHVVLRGDTLFSIASLYGVSVSAMTDANDLLNPAQIYVGQELVVPGVATSDVSGYTPTESADVYTVRRGDTLFSIATRHNISQWVLAQTNDISNPGAVQVGQVLTIPSTTALTQEVVEQTIIETQAPTAVPSSGQKIVVDVSEQRTYVYEGERLIWNFISSTGMPGSDTMRGSFQVQNKIPMAYASTWDLDMPHWIGFYWAGPLQNGFHALPILSNGVRLWAGLLGQPASYGCVILSDHDAKLLYDWVQVGTPVIVQN